MTILHKFNDVSLRIKLAAMLTPLVIGLLIFIVQDVTSGVAERRDMSELNEFTGFAKSVNEVVHESQKERGRTGLFMGSGGESFAAELADQRAVTDTRRSELDHFLLNFNAAKVRARIRAALRPRHERARGPRRPPHFRGCAIAADERGDLVLLAP